MQIVYANEEFPKEAEKMIFLVGPTPRKEGVISWRIEALRILEESGYNGHVFVPEPRDGKWQRDYYSQIRWEKKGLAMADCILCWIPRSKDFPAYTTNTEVGMYASSGKIVLGAPKDAPKMKYLRALGEDYNVPQAETLESTVKKAMEMLGAGALRRNGECDVPLHIWNTSSFQEWYQSQKAAGNRLDGAKIEWTFWVDRKARLLFFWALHVDVHIAAEGRNKTNEVVIGRPVISSVVMYKKGKNIMDTQVVLVKEFRSPASTVDGFICELPGGSSFKPIESHLVLAADEAEEETGLKIGANRLKLHSARQLMGTLSAHRAHLFSLELDPVEIEDIEKNRDIAFGIEEDSERTYVGIYKFEEILKSNFVDWSTIGMISAVLMEIYGNK